MSNYWYPLAFPTIGEEEIDAAVNVLRSGHTTMGGRVEEFEEAFASKVGTKYAVMVNSGSSADLLVAMCAPSSGEVLIPAVTWPTHAWSFKLAGFDPTFVDCGANTLNTTQRVIDEATTSETVGVALPHIMGVRAKVTTDLWLAEDCCEALGTEGVGSQAYAAAWSFFFSHQMTTMEGGMVTTNSWRLAERLRSMRSHGWTRGSERSYPGIDSRYCFDEVGLNVRPTEVSAAIGLVQLRKLDAMNAVRATNREILISYLKDTERITVLDHDKQASWFGLAMLVDDRDLLAKHLEANGIETRPILGGNLAQQPAFEGWKTRDLPNAQYVHNHGLYIGLRSDDTADAFIVGKWIKEWAKS